MNIHQCDISSVLKTLPDINELNLTGRCDFIVATLGFEDRTHAIIEKFTNSAAQKNCFIVLVRYPTNKDDNEKNYHFFTEAAKKLNTKLIEITYNSTSF